LLERVAGCFNAFVNRLEKHALLRVHCLGFFGTDGEEVTIKGTRVILKKIGMFRVGTLNHELELDDLGWNTTWTTHSMVLTIWVIECTGVETTGGDLIQDISRFLQ